MVYVGSAETTAISAELPEHVHSSFLIQRVLGSYLAGPTHLYLHWLPTSYALWTTRYVMLDTRLVLTTCAKQHFSVANHQSDCKLKTLSLLHLCHKVL